MGRVLGGVTSGVFPMLRGNLTPNSRLQEFQPVVRWRGRWSSCGSGEHTHTFCVGGIWYLVFEWTGFWGGVTSGVLPMLRGNLTPNSRLQEFQPVVRWRGRWSNCGSGEQTRTFCVGVVWYLVFEWTGFWGCRGWET